jgi:hypothetical protein
LLLRNVRGDSPINDLTRYLIYTEHLDTFLKLASAGQFDGQMKWAKACSIAQSIFFGIMLSIPSQYKKCL